MNKIMKKIISMILTCALFFCMLSPISAHAETLADRATSTVKFGECEQIELKKDEITTLKIVMTQKGTFSLDFSPEKNLQIYAQLYDESNNLLGQTTDVYGKLSNISFIGVLKPSDLGYNKDLEPGTYYLNIWPISWDEGTYTYYARQIPSKNTSLEICISLKKGRSIQLGTIFSNVSSKNRKVTWKTSNKKIATVTSKGKVTAVKKGTATIKVFNNSGLLAKIKIKVTE